LPIGYLVTTMLVACCAFFALAPPRPHHSSPSNLSYWFGFLLNELPFVAFYRLLASTLLAIGQGDVKSPVGWVALAVAALTTLGLVVVAWRGAAGRPGDRPCPERGPRCWLAHRHRCHADGWSAAPSSTRAHPVRAALRPPSRCRAGGEHQLRRRAELESA
jgi:hypothetical protein